MELDSPSPNLLDAGLTVSSSSPSLDVADHEGLGQDFPLLGPSAPGTVSPPVLGRSFAETLKLGNAARDESGNFNAFYKTLPISFENILAGQTIKGDPVGVKSVTYSQGKPCIHLTNEEILLLNKPLELTLIGKFHTGRPKWFLVQRHFMSLKFKGAYKLTNLDDKHIVLHLSNHDDYTKVFARTVTTIYGYSVKFLKWSMDFDINSEPSITPIWITIPNLCMNMFTQGMLFSIAQAYGKPLLLDKSTACGSNPGMARVLVEMDLLIDHPKEVKLGNDEFGYSQVVTIERKPKYCSHCRMYGHMVSECYTKHPELKKNHRGEKKKEKVGKGTADDGKGDQPLKKQEWAVVNRNAGKRSMVDAPSVVDDQLSGEVSKLDVVEPPPDESRVGVRGQEPFGESDKAGVINPEVEGLGDVNESERTQGDNGGMAYGGGPENAVVFEVEEGEIVPEYNMLNNLEDARLSEDSEGVMGGVVGGLNHGVDNQGINLIQERFWKTYIKKAMKDKEARVVVQSEGPGAPILVNSEQPSSTQKAAEEAEACSTAVDGMKLTNIEQMVIRKYDPDWNLEKCRLEDGNYWLAEEDFARLAAQTLEESVNRVLEECYDKAFQITQRDSRPASPIDPIEGFSPITVGSLQVDQEGSEGCMEEESGLGLKGTLTKANIIDMQCLGFDMEGCQDDESIMGEEESDIPPHSKSRRKSWGDENNSKIGAGSKGKRGRKKKNEVVRINLGSPRRTRGKAKENLETDENIWD